MRKAAAILVGAILVGGFAAGAGARSSRVITLGLHGTVTLTGSHVRCGSATLRGLTYIDCGISNAAGQPKLGGYVALMTSDGRVTIIAVSTKKTVFSRAPAGVRRVAAGTPVAAGDVINVARTSISCNASRIGGKPTILCYYLDKRGVVRPNSYSFGISDTIVTSLGWDSKGKVHVLKSWPENG